MRTRNKRLRSRLKREFEGSVQAATVELEDLDDNELEDRQLNGRMCIVSRERLPADRLIRFVMDPSGEVVPDLKRRLPGRGAHVEATREAVEAAVRRNHLRRALRGSGQAPVDLAERVDALLARSALGAMGLARKAGQMASGAAKVEAEVRGGRAVALLQALDGAADSLRKMDGARRAAEASGRAGEIAVFRLFTADEMGLALGGANVVHAAVLAGNAGAALKSRLAMLESFRGSGSGRSDLAGLPGAEAASASDSREGRFGIEAAGTDEAPGQASGQEAEV